MGHRISEEGIETDDSRIKMICKWHAPKTVTEVRSFLGFTNYYSRFIYKYAQVTKPLYQLISGENASKKIKAIVWDGECEEAFRKLKEICTSTPILACAEFSKLFKLHTDACTSGLTAILYQNNDGDDHIIGYTSRSLSKTEHKYPAHKLEFIALKWKIMEQFHEYLYGNNFVIYTENYLLTYVLNSVKLDSTGHHCVATLANYNFAFSYRSGKMNIDADAIIS